MKAALYPNFKKKNALKTSLKVCDILNKLDISVLVDIKYMNEFSEKSFVGFGDMTSIANDADIIIAIGGDGTIIKASVYSVQFDKQLLGINTGHLGFMASMEIDELENLSKLKTGEYTTEKRMMIDCILEKSDGERVTFSALNDVVVARSCSKLTDYSILTDGIVVSSLRSDGVVFATPTGSTAYALSCGGPIMEPRTECIQFTPICPHSLFARTMLFSADRELELIHYNEGTSSVYFSIDGMDGIVFSKNERLIIRKSNKYLRLIDIKGNSFFDAVNNKLMNAIK